METEDSFIGNALLKARRAHALTGQATLADDSGLCVDALGGAPGVHTADWAETGQGRDWMQAMARVERELAAQGPGVSRRAHFVAVLALVLADGTEHVFEGRAHGSLTWPPRGHIGFGYDPVFVPDGHSQTFAELPFEAKQALSHRTRAFEALLAAGVLAT